MLAPMTTAITNEDSESSFSLSAASTALDVVAESSNSESSGTGGDGRNGIGRVGGSTACECVSSEIKDGTNGLGGGDGGGGGGDHACTPSQERGGAGGGGSSYTGHPQLTSGSTTGAGPSPGGARADGGGVGSPLYIAGTNEGGCGNQQDGEDGYVLITGCGSATASSTIVSNAFAAGSVPTTSRIVVFEERVSSLTLNTDLIASISRDGGSNYTTATLSDSGYVTGSSGQRILTGTATISGQPSGQSMRWKLALANNAVKIHGVALQWN